MEESLKSLRWSMLAMNAGCLSIVAALLTLSNETKTVTVMSFQVSIDVLLMMGYAVVLLLQGHTQLHLKHISRLSSAGRGKDELSASPVLAMHAGHDDTSLDSFLSESLLFVQLLFLPIFAGATTAAVSAGAVFLGMTKGLNSVLFLFPLAMLAVTVVSAWRSHRLFRSLCKQIDLAPI